jgi:hypothetical protein
LTTQKKLPLPVKTFFDSWLHLKRHKTNRQITRLAASTSALPRALQLSGASLDSAGLYLLYCGLHQFVWFGAQCDPSVVRALLGNAHPAPAELTEITHVPVVPRDDAPALDPAATTLVERCTRINNALSLRYPQRQVTWVLWHMV